MSDFVLFHPSATTGSEHEVESNQIRICPGRYFALSSLFVTVASVLHVFDIAPPMDDQGRPVLATHGMTEGFSSRVLSCCSPRHLSVF